MRIKTNACMLKPAGIHIYDPCDIWHAQKPFSHKKCAFHSKIEHYLKYRNVSNYTNYIYIKLY